VNGNGASYINTSNNIFVDCGGPYEMSEMLPAFNGAQYDLLLPKWKAAFAQANASGMLPRFFARYPELRTFWDEDRRAPKSNTFSRAIIYNPTVPRGGSFNEVTRNFSSRGFACDQCAASDIVSQYVWLAAADPGFGDISKMNFSLAVSRVRDHIPAWREIDFDAIGPKMDCVGSGARCKHGGTTMKIDDGDATVVQLSTDGKAAVSHVLLPAARASAAPIWGVKFDGSCNVRSRGAVGDNHTDDTPAFAAVLLDPACTTIVVPGPKGRPGRAAYLLKPLPSMHSNTELLLQPGAVLQLWRDLLTYPNATKGYYAQWNQSHSDCFVIEQGKPAVCRSAPLLRADAVENITIHGGGEIRGSGPQLWYNTTTFPFSYNFWHMCRPLLVATNNLKNLLVENISLLDGPYIHFGADAENLRIDRLTVATAAWQCKGYDGAPNTDCVDLSGTNIHVSNSRCHNGDDCWPLLPSFSNYSARGSAPPPPGNDQHGLTTNVLIRDSVCQCGNGVRVMRASGLPSFLFGASLLLQLNVRLRIGVAN
jgi:hypothetical protein